MTQVQGKAASLLGERLGYEFTDPDLLKQALTHSSSAIKPSQTNNERLEFLGDRVLGLVIAQILYERHEDVPEGELARMLNAMVRRETCARVAEALGIADALVLAGKGTRRTTVTENILGDACEALIAAIYIDGGLEEARSFIKRHWTEHLNKAPTIRKDPKSSLQEWAAARAIAVPVYETVEVSGPAHAPEFKVELTIEGREKSLGTSTTRRAAEHEAALNFLKREGIWKS